MVILVREIYDPPPDPRTRHGNDAVTPLAIRVSLRCSTRIREPERSFGEPSGRNVSTTTRRGHLPVCRSQHATGEPIPSHRVLAAFPWTTDLDLDTTVEYLRSVPDKNRDVIRIL